MIYARMRLGDTHLGILKVSAVKQNVTNGRLVRNGQRNEEDLSSRSKLHVSMLSIN